MTITAVKKMRMSKRFVLLEKMLVMSLKKFVRSAITAIGLVM